METLSPPPPVPDRLGRAGIARLLVLLQGAVLVAATIETLVVMSAMDPGALPTLVLTAAAAVLTFLAAWGIGRGSRWARRWTIVAEAGVLLLVAADLAIAAFLGGLELVPMTVVLRIGVPIAVITLLRRPRTRPAAALPDRPLLTDGGLA